jgi:hypothetical protein
LEADQRIVEDLRVIDGEDGPDAQVLLRIVHTFRRQSLLIDLHLEDLPRYLD